ncbi:B3 domain-containing protein At3g19184 [Linum grandiflorum]
MLESKKKLISYDEIRRQRLEENRKRMEDLNLLQLARHLRPQPKSSPAKPRAPKAVLGPARRSSRIADKPNVSYKEGMVEPLQGLRVRRSPRYHRRYGGVYASRKARDHAIERAEELESILDKEFPTFVRPMLPSHVAGGFWLGLPRWFCSSYLPKKDEMMTLIDDKEESSETKYLAAKNGLSGGWKGFAVDHQLVDGDALVFQLINPTEFKVHIIRVNDGEGGDDDSENESQEEEENDSDKENQQGKEEDPDKESQQGKEDDSEKEKQKEAEVEDDSAVDDGTRRRSKRLRAARK